MVKTHVGKNKHRGTKASRVNSSLVGLSSLSEGSDSPWHGVLQCNITPVRLDAFYSAEKPGKRPDAPLLQLVVNPINDDVKNWRWRRLRTEAEE